MLNTRYQTCNPILQNCCPHMGPDKAGHYRATNETSQLNYQGDTYDLKTCCPMCADAMRKLLRENPRQFEEQYKPKIINNRLQLLNKVTGKPIQMLPITNTL